jgi:DNA-directed RNA polymerase specialized sigma24 family protein
MTSDSELLHTYAEQASEEAFAELVSRYLDLVFSAALRQVGGDTHLAQDVAQTVFTALATKAGSLPENVFLGGWLYRHTRSFAFPNAKFAILRRPRRLAVVLARCLGADDQATGVNRMPGGVRREID